MMEKKRRQYHPSDQPLVTRAELARAECNSWTMRFVEKFPHLKRVAGFYGAPEDVWLNDPDEEIYRTEHWWCVDTDGTIVDPTAEQFMHGDFVYTPFDEAKHRIKIGRCMECGDDIFGLKAEGPKSACSEECTERLTEYYNSI